MCGIFGIIIKENSSLEIKSVKKTLKNFLVFSCDRGQEATGLMIKSRKNKEISMIKRAVKSKDFIDDKDFKSFSNKYLDEQNIKNGISVFGHTRIATNGSLFLDNQPIAKNGVYGIHNGIICNVEKLWWP